MNIVVLLAGGSGNRMKMNIPKQHIVVMSHQVIEYTLTAFCYNEAVDAVMVVSNPDYIDTVKSLQERFGKLKWIIPGGKTRMLSVYNAIKYLDVFCTDEDKIIISDAVRPCITFREVKEVYDRLEQFNVVSTCVEIYESVLRISDRAVSSFIPRDGLVRQTSPEGYRFSILKKLYLETEIHQIEQYKNIGIDQLLLTNETVGIVYSTPLNFKITTQEDLFYFNTVLKKGFDTILNGEIHIE